MVQIDLDELTDGAGPHGRVKFHGLFVMYPLEHLGPPSLYKVS